jgi:hypothetical protein
VGFLEGLEHSPTVCHALAGYKGPPLPGPFGKVRVVAGFVEKVQLVVDPTQVARRVVEAVLVYVVHNPKV